MKTAMTWLFKWIIDNGYFGVIHICASVHDEICCDYPEEIKEFPRVLEDTMERAAAKYCKSLPIPAEASVGDYWIH
jgi:DNA polymerase I-like protein with 3'-5' exonuclease and polymerase domains